jgi:hypothetical protein
MGGGNFYAYAGDDPTNSVDPSGLDWIEYTGQQLTLYGGDYPARGMPMMECTASSGLPGYQSSKLQGKSDSGPIPQGHYRVNLLLDPNRVAQADANGNLLASNGVQRIADVYHTPNGDYEEPGWGTWRASAKSQGKLATRRLLPS